MKHAAGELGDAVKSYNWKKPRLEDVGKYHRAGIAYEALASMYEIETDDVGRLIRDHYYDEEPAVIDHSMSVEMIEPSEGVEAYVEVLLQVRVMVNNHKDVRMVWLEAAPGNFANDPDRFLAEGTGGDRGNTYDPAKQAIVLWREKHSRDSIFYAGGIKVKEMPPQGKLILKLRVPAEDVPTNWSHEKPPEVILLRQFEIKVATL